MSGNYNLVEGAHLVLCNKPIDANDAAQVGTTVNTKLGDKVLFLVQCGVYGAATTVTVEECTDAAGADNVAIAFNYYLSTTADSSSFGARTAATAAGVAIGGATRMLAIDIDASELSPTKPFVRVKIDDPGVATLTSVVAIIHPVRYASLAANQPSAIV